VLVERNLLASNAFRNPLVDAGTSAVVLNNLIYNPGWSGFHVYSNPKAGPTFASVVGNVSVAGPSAQPKERFRSFSKGVNPGSRIFYSDNLAIGRDAFSLEERAGESSLDPVPFVDAPPIWFDWLRPIASAEVESSVLAEVGARPSERDETDARLVAEVRSRTGSIKDTPADPRLQVARPLATGATPQ
jgi:hypothetical protein